MRGGAWSKKFLPRHAPLHTSPERPQRLGWGHPHLHLFVRLGERPFLPCPPSPRPEELLPQLLIQHSKGWGGRAGRPLPPSTPGPYGFQGNQSGPSGSPQNKEPQCGLARGQPAWRLPRVIPSLAQFPLTLGGRAAGRQAGRGALWSRGGEMGPTHCKGQLLPPPRPASRRAAPLQPPRPLTLTAGQQGCGWSRPPPVPGPHKVVPWRGMGSLQLQLLTPTPSCPQGGRPRPPPFRGCTQPEVSLVHDPIPDLHL